MKRAGLEAIAFMMLMTAAANCLGQNRTAADNQRQTAIALEQEGKNAEAAAAWRIYIKAQPADAEAYAHLGLLEARQEHYTIAVPLYRKALALNPKMPGLRLNLGLALFKAGQLRPAILMFNSLLKSQSSSSPEVQRLKTLLGMAHYGLGEYTAAIPYMKAAIASDPQNSAFRLVLAHSCLAAKQYQCVLDVYKEILTLNAESAEADMLAGEAADEMSDHATATQYFRAAVKANPQEPNVHFGLGYLLWTQSQYEEAAKEFEAELTTVPNHVQALTYLADTNIKMNNPEVALPLLKQAIQLDPQMQLAHLDLGIVHMNADRKDEALRELKIAVRLNPNEVNAHWRLARLYQAMGNKEEAKVEFDKTKSLTKAADESVSSKLGNAHPKERSIEGSADKAASR